jgi:glycosyltransferase involved in cell wall biosynthesis
MKIVNQNKIMKICFVNDTFLVGRGVDTVIYELARRLGKKHKVKVICGKGLCNYRPENFEVEEIDIGKAFTGSFKDFLLPIKLLKLRKRLRRIDYDVINLHHSTLFLGLIGIKNVVVTYHGSPPAYGISKYPRTLINLFGRFSLRFAKKVIAISKYLKEELIKFGVPKEKIIVIPDGVSEEFKPTWKDKNYMLFVGRLERHKRVDELIRLSKEINFPLKIVGDGPERKKLEKLVKEIRAPVTFVGKVSREKLIELYQECSFFVSASRWEGFGLIFLEANACGKPVIAYKLCAIPEIIKNNGFLVKSVEEFREKVNLLKNNKKLRKQIGMNALKFVRKFNWNKIAKKYETVFNTNLQQSESAKGRYTKICL